MVVVSKLPDLSFLNSIYCLTHTRWAFVIPNDHSVLWQGLTHERVLFVDLLTHSFHCFPFIEI